MYHQTRAEVFSLVFNTLYTFAINFCYTFIQNFMRTGTLQLHFGAPFAVYKQVWFSNLVEENDPVDVIILESKAWDWRTELSRYIIWDSREDGPFSWYEYAIQQGTQVAVWNNGEVSYVHFFGLLQGKCLTSRGSPCLLVKPRAGPRWSTDRHGISYLKGFVPYEDKGTGIE